MDAGGLNRSKSPEGFIFRTAAWAYQVEGMARNDGRGPNISGVFIKILVYDQRLGENLSFIGMGGLGKRNSLWI